MSVQNEITRLADAKAAIAAAITDKGVTVPDGTLLDGLAALIGDIETGGGLPTMIEELRAQLFIPSSDSSSITIEHDMSKAPNFLVWWYGGNLSTTAIASLAISGAVTVKTACKQTDSSTVYTYRYMSNGYKSDGTHTTTSGQGQARGNPLTETEVEIATHTTNYKFLASKVYRCVFGRMTGIS